MTRSAFIVTMELRLPLILSCLLLSFLPPVLAAPPVSFSTSIQQGLAGLALALDDTVAPKRGAADAWRELVTHPGRDRIHPDFIQETPYVVFRSDL